MKKPEIVVLFSSLFLCRNLLKVLTNSWSPGQKTLARNTALIGLNGAILQMQKLRRLQMSGASYHNKRKDKDLQAENQLLTP
jgi:hypothetical protein